MVLQDARKLANDLMQEHGLTNWTFYFDSSVRRFGACHHGTRCISLSKALTELNDETQVRNTLLHEIAHALVGRGHGHDAVWRAKAIELGDDGKRCYDSNIVNRPAPKFMGRCPSCDHKIYKNRRGQSACGLCCRKHNNGRYSEEYRIRWSKNLVAHT